MERESILLADDDRLILATLGEGLRQAGFTVLDASDGDQAVQLCEIHQPNLAILDVRMPGQSGVDAARRIRESSGVPFMFLTAYGDRELVQQAVTEGALGYLVKPLDVPQVVPAVDAALARAAELHQLRTREMHLSNALSGGRDTSMAVGLIMERYRLDRQQAFEALRFHSRSQRRKMATVAADLLQAAEAMRLPAEIIERVTAIKD